MFSMFTHSVLQYLMYKDTYVQSIYYIIAECIVCKCEILTMYYALNELGGCLQKKKKSYCLKKLRKQKMRTVIDLSLYIYSY